MADEWDTIVIGAGVGGLTAAAMLARSGRRVLVLERSPHPGGTAYVYRRQGFTFPMGPLGFSSPGIVRDVLRDLNAETGLDFRRVHYRLRAFGLDVPLSLPFEETAAELAGCFPGESAAIRRFFADVGETVAALQTADAPSPEVAATPAADYLGRAVKDRRLRRILGSIGTAEPYSSFALLAAMWHLVAAEGIWYPDGGLRSIVEALARVVVEGGGTVRLGAEVSRIRVEEGVAAGVTLADGSTLDARSVVSNADYKTTFLDLLGPDAVPREWYDAVCGARQTGSVLQVCLGVDGRRVDLSAFGDAGRVIYRRDDSEDGRGGGDAWGDGEVGSEAVAGQELEVSWWSRGDAGLAPPGGEVIVIRTPTPYSHFASFSSGRGGRVPGYRDYKVRLAQALIRETGRLLPGLDDAVLVTDVATPLTFHDRGGRSEGAVAGWSWDYEDFPDSRPRELVLTPLRGLYMAGYQAFTALFLGGVPTAIESGRRAARAVLDGVGPAEDIAIPGSR